jgi:outer membrane protein TolC
MFLRPVRVVLLLLLVVLVGVLCWRLGSRRADRENRDGPRVRELLKERLAAATEIYNSSLERMKVGVASPGEVHEARRAMLRAQLDLCESDKERVAVMEQCVEGAKEQEKIFRALINAGLLPPIDARKAEISRLEAEIELERMKAK